MRAQPLPQFLQDLIAHPPSHGEGVHQWLYGVARNLHAHRAEEDIFQLLQAKSGGGQLGRAVPDREIREAVTASKETAWRPTSTTSPATAKAKWPTPNENLRCEVIAEQRLELADLWEASPVRLDESGPDAESIIDALFPPDSLLCVGKSARKFSTLPRETWRGELKDNALIVPSPMTSRHGKRKSDGELSEHTLDNTGPRRFLVVEFDTGTSDDHASLLSYLSDFAGLVLVVHSGNKSLHGWFYVEDDPPDRRRRFFRHAVEVGADPATWTRSQFVRMPFGTRDNGEIQKPYFFNPTHCEHENI